MSPSSPFTFYLHKNKYFQLSFIHNSCFNLLISWVVKLSTLELLKQLGKYLIMIKIIIIIIIIIIIVIIAIIIIIIIFIYLFYNNRSS